MVGYFSLQKIRTSISSLGDNYLILTKRKCSIVLHATTVESVHCTRDVQKKLGVCGHDPLKLMLGSSSSNGRAILYSSSLTHTLIPPYALSE